MITLISSSFFSLPKDSSRVNQDSCLLPLNNDNRIIFAIADGLGGYKGGKEASQKVIEFINEHYKDYAFETFDDLFNDLKISVMMLSETNKELVNAATTLTLCFIKENKLHIGHIGDCRLYGKIKNKLVQLTKDHTQQQVLIDQGVFTKKQLEKSLVKNVLTTAISKTLKLDYELMEVSLDEIVDDEGFINLYLMSDGAHAFWEKRPRFSINTINEPSRFASSLLKRIKNGPPIDDHSLISVKMKYENRQ